MFWWIGSLWNMLDCLVRKDWSALGTDVNAQFCFGFTIRRFSCFVLDLKWSLDFGLGMSFVILFDWICCM